MTRSQQHWSKVGVVAGGGDLPARLASFCSASGRELYVIRLAGLAEAALRDFPGEECGLAEAGRMLSILKREGCDAVSLVGLVKRPNFTALKPDLKGVALLPRIAAAAARGDDALLSAILQVFEDQGFTVLGADDLAADLLAPAGPMGRISPSEEDLIDMARAARIVEALGALDVGQGAVVCRGLPLAVEAAEGTDDMLSRCAALPAEVRGDEGDRRGVLVKAPKPHQERRVDLPVIGPTTLEGAARAGLAGVAVAAGGALVIDRNRVIELADKFAMFVYGFAPDELRAIPERLEQHASAPAQEAKE